MKKIQLMLICFLAIFTAGCSKMKSAISSQEYYDTVVQSGYTVQDSKAAYAYAKASYLIEEKDIKLLYVKGERKYDIEGIFIDECKNVYNLIGAEEYEQKVLGGDNWTSLEITTKESFYYVSWIEDSYIYLSAPIANQKDLKSLIKKIGF